MTVNTLRFAPSASIWERWFDKGFAPIKFAALLSLNLDTAYEKDIAKPDHPMNARYRERRMDLWARYGRDTNLPQRYQGKSNPARYSEIVNLKDVCKVAVGQVWVEALPMTIALAPEYLEELLARFPDDQSNFRQGSASFINSSEDEGRPTESMSNDRLIDLAADSNYGIFSAEGVAKGEKYFWYELGALVHVLDEVLTSPKVAETFRRGDQLNLSAVGRRMVEILVSGQHETLSDGQHNPLTYAKKLGKARTLIGTLKPTTGPHRQ